MCPTRTQKKGKEMAKDSGFNLVEILNQRSRLEVKVTGDETEGARELAKADGKELPERQQIMMIDIDDLLPSNENFYQVDDSLKQSIELVGVLQPLLVDRPENGKYKVLAGHRRRLAVLSLLKEGKEERRYVPCVYKEDGVADRLAIIMANRFREKTDWEKMMEIVEVEKLAQELKQDYGLKGRSRDVTARLMGISQAQIGRYKAIYNNLNKGLMEKFKAGILGFSVVSELCSLSGEQQKNAERLMKGNGTLTLPEVKTLKSENSQVCTRTEQEERQDIVKGLEKGGKAEKKTGSYVHGEMIKAGDSGCVAFDGLGRIEIPEEVRRQLKIRKGQRMDIFADERGRIILQKHDMADREQ